MNLLPVVHTSLVERYLETDYPTLTDMIYRPRKKGPEPKYYDPENDVLKEYLKRTPSLVQQICWKLKKIIRKYLTHRS